MYVEKENVYVMGEGKKKKQKTTEEVIEESWNKKAKDLQEDEHIWNGS